MNRVVESTRVVRGWPEDAARLSIPTRFEDHARAKPAAHAVRTANQTLSYGALNEAANRLARAVLAETESSTVAVLAGHGVSMIVGMLGVLKAGKIFVPVDHRQPRARMLQILADCEARLLLTDEKHFSTACDLVRPGVRILNVDAPAPTFSAENLNLPIDHHSTACLHYTSGSTGSPKGVLQTHRNLVHKTMAFTEALELSPDDRLTQLASCATGQGLSTALQGLLNGASLHPFDIREAGLGKLAASLTEHQITVYRSSASIFRHFVKTLTGADVFPNLRMITIGGERIRPEDVELYKQHFSENCRFASTFSATETGLISLHLMDHGTSVPDVVPVGYPRQDLTITIVDETSREVPIGERGEIVVRSSLLSPGYWRDPARTAEVFSIVPGSPDERVYRTGDLGRFRADGCLEHLGRKDFRIKLRGFRVELEEIERTLCDHPLVSEAVAALRRDGTGEERICAYVVAEATQRPTATELRMHIRTTLPEQMVPSAFVFLDVLPLAASGKVDRSALPAPGQDRASDDSAAIPLTTVQKTLADIWRVVLGVSPVGNEEDFFESGGDSLRAGQVISRIYQELHVDIPVTRFMEAPTIVRLAQVIERQLEDEEKARLETIECLLAEVENLPDA
jgi:amino acid adenylation domain-containing protein